MQISEANFTLEEVPEIPLSLLKVCVCFTTQGRFVKCSCFLQVEETLLIKEKNGEGEKGRKAQ